MQNEIYLVVERNVFNNNEFKCIGACYTYDKAKSYCDKIYKEVLGPYPILGDIGNFIHSEPQNIIPNNPFKIKNDKNILPDFYDFFETAKPRQFSSNIFDSARNSIFKKNQYDTDFNMKTPPPSKSNTPKEFMEE